jgi:hypothetical protein
MARFVGRITQTETRAPVRDLVVRALRLVPVNEGRDTSVVSLGSAATNGAGAFEIVSILPEAETPARVVLAVAAPDGRERGGEGERRPEDTTFDPADFLFVCPPREVGPEGNETFRLSIDLATLEAAGILPPDASTAGDRLAVRARRAVEEAAKAEREVGDAVASRVREDRVLEDAFKVEFLPRLLASATATAGTVISPDYEFVVGPEADHAPGELARRAIQRGVARFQTETNQAPGPARTGRRRTRFYFDAAQLQALDDTTTASGSLPEGQFNEISEPALFEILGINERIALTGAPVEVSREEKLFDAFLVETREEQRMRALLRPVEEPGAAEEPVPDVEPEIADGPAVLTRLARTINDVRSPLDALTGGGEGPGLATAIRDFAVPVGPADEPRVFDFATLEVAFDDVWQSVVDRRLEPLAQSLHVQASRVLKGTVFQAADLADLPSLSRALATVRTATQGSAPSVVFLRNDGRGPKKTGLGAGGEVLIPEEPDPPPPPDPEPEGPDFPIFEVFGFVTQEDDGSNLDTDATPENLIEQINAILRQPHAFTAFGADERSKAINFGLLVGYRHLMTPVTYQVGDLVKSITLAPGESREYKTRTTITRKRAEKEMLKNSAVRRDELSNTSRVESEIVRKALAKTNFSLTSSGTYNLGFSKGKTNTASGRDGESNSSEVKKSFREAVIKASEEVRQERSVDVTFDESFEFEETTTGRLENQNKELTLTCLFFELQRRFRVNETIQKATPVVLVAQDVPAPDEITNAFLVRYAWIIRRALLDDGFEPALTYVQGRIVADRLEVLALLDTLATHRTQAKDLTTQLQALEEQAGRRYEALVRAVKERIDEEGHEERDGFFSDLGDSLFGGGQTTETAKLREEAARDAEQRAAEKAKEMAVQLQRAVNALNEATEAYNKANRRYQSMDLEVARLRLHVKEHILHYMQAIWMHEVDDQRFLRLYQLPVPQFVQQGGTEPVYRRLGADAGLSRVEVTPTGNNGAPVAERRTAVDFELVPSIEVLGPELDRPLVEVADPSRLLGFLGNYMIFPMRQSNALTDLMLNPYVDEGLRLLDPHDPGNITRPQFAEYVDRLRKRLSDEEFEAIRGALAERYAELLLSSEYAGDEIVVPSGALYMEALPGSTPLLEPFKLAHRAFDLVAAQEEARQATIENLRLAARLIEGQLDDPETDARYDFFGAPGVVPPAPAPPGGPGPGEGGGGG